ncbi:MAG TPA: acyltransferase domain-containing protein [bacterium]|uniref:Malonyl CoA-acyl carrier protein transacylase n=1 Tax=candidate division TA06 bacterium ADurb.Bin417 TaxID=1852828 RepID=A0A1V5MGG3_UNCT6|nr:MAG: Malonyl CoA-acyl carrier protein transacylase [candidate division TA06 bacterium ADurb.Bin417]HNS48187.1 acyltransferase domain-containing protein [bacterium]
MPLPESKTGTGAAGLLLVWTDASVAGLVSRLESFRASLEAGGAAALSGLVRSVNADYESSAGEGRLCLALAVRSPAELLERTGQALEKLKGGADSFSEAFGLHFQTRPAAGGRVAFLFPGQGSQRPGMLRELVEAFPELRSAFETADRVLAGRLSRPLSDYVFPSPAAGPEEEKRQLEELTATNVAQPALGAAGFGFSRLLESLGVTAGAAAGHSAGEYPALCLAGVFSEAALYDLLEFRGASIIAGAAGRDLGTMLAAAADAGRVSGIIEGLADVYPANLNSPRQTVLSGRADSLRLAAGRLKEQGIRSVPIPVSCAFHSPFVQPARERLAARLAQVAFQAPRLPVYANALAAVYPSEPARVADILSGHLVSPVRFVEEVEAMYRDGCTIFVESGPRSVLTGLVDQILEGRPHLAVAGNTGKGSDWFDLLNCLARLAAAGIRIRLVALAERMA